MLRLANKSPIGSEEWSDKLRRKARDLAGRINRDYMDLGEILYTVWDTPVDGDRQKPPIYTSWGYESFSDYAEQELNLNRRTAEHLRRIYYVLEVELRGLDPLLRRKFIGLGRSKARELVRVLTMQNARDWILMAEKVSYKELVATIKGRLEEIALQEAVDGSDSEDNLEPPELPAPLESLKRRTFALYTEQDANVGAALSRAQQLSKSEKSGHNLDLICTDFLATNDFRSPDDPNMWKRMFSKYENFLKKHIVVLDPKTKTIWYGGDKLKAFVEGM